MAPFLQASKGPLKAIQNLKSIKKLPKNYHRKVHSH